jgi:hypothetical protein
MASSTRSRIVIGTLVVVAAFAFACGGTTAPAPGDADAGADGATARGDAASADAGFEPIPCGNLTCADATPYCLVIHVCGYGPADCKTPASDGGACPEGYAACADASGKPGCASLYTYSCRSSPSCQPTGPRTYGNCSC